MGAGIKATGGGIVAPKEGDRGEGSGNQQGSDVYLEYYVPEDGPDKETVVKYANKWGAIVLLPFFKFYTSFFLMQCLSLHHLPILFQYLFLLPCMPYL